MKRPKLITNEEVEKVVDKVLAFDPEHYGFMDRVKRIWRKIFPPTPHGPCAYCGEDTSHENMFQDGLFYHPTCSTLQFENEKAAKEERKQIELIKVAIRELEAEKLKKESL